MPHQLHILIVDHDQNARECLRDMLEVEGYATCSSSPGSEALRLVHGTEAPCIVLLNGVRKARTGLEQLTLLEQEQYLLDVAVSVMNDAALTNEDPAPAVETAQERHLFQLAMTERKAQVHPFEPPQKPAPLPQLPLAAAG